MKHAREIKLALVATLAIILLFIGLNFLKGMNVFSSDDVYYITFDNISGLAKSSPIYADGYKVGVVRDVDYDYDGTGRLLVKFTVDKGMRIPSGSSAEIESDLMGNVKMNLLLGNDPRHKCEPGDTLKGTLNEGMMAKAGALIPQVQQILPKVDSILTRVNTLLQDPAIANSLHNVEGITNNLNTASRQVNTLMAQLNGRVPGMMGKADHVLDNTQRLTANLAAVDINSTMNEVNQTIGNMRAFSEQLKNNKGSLGLLMNDPSLYNNLNSTMLHADSLVVNLREHPKRYVHFSLFGKKDN